MMTSNKRKKYSSLEEAERLFRKVYMKALTDYEESCRELETSKKTPPSPPQVEEVKGFDDEEEEEEEVTSWLQWSSGGNDEAEDIDWRDLQVPTNPFEAEPTWLSEPARTRWTKEDILAICDWPKAHWTKLKNRLELNVGLIKLQHGAGNPWKGEVIRCWTFSTSPEDRKMGILNSPALQAQERLRLGQAIKVARLLEAQREITPEEIEEELEAQKVELAETLETLRTLNKVLLTPEMLKMLEAENEND